MYGLGMLTAGENTGSVISAIGLEDADIARSLACEWLLTNSRGGFSCGTVVGCNTRRYHGLLTGSLKPPVGRIAALSNCLETVAAAGQQIQLSTFEFEGVISPDGYRYLTAFRKDTGVHFDYNLGFARLTKSVYLMPDNDAVAVVYEFSGVLRPFEFSVRPLVACRDFHSLQRSSACLFSVWRGDGLAVRCPSDGLGELFIRSDDMWFRQDPQWWYRFFYRVDNQRGQDCFEDLWSPGLLNAHVEAPVRLVFWASLGQCGSEDEYVDLHFDVDTVIDSLALRDRALTAAVRHDDAVLNTLCRAAGQFVIERTYRGVSVPTILAGYPWFMDWGRDTFISLPGLLLCTGQYETAAGVLTTFARAIGNGMIPNRFDDYTEQAHYNSVDASLWFVYAAFEYLRHTADSTIFLRELLPAIRWIMDSYRRGTSFNIHTDTDGLVSAGDSQTQLTWMDAKFDGVVFTPRYGRVVEVNALWYSALCRLAGYYADKNRQQYTFYNEQARKVGQSFCRVFWNESNQCLYDCVFPDGRADGSIRPNQIFAVSLPYPPLGPDKQEAVVNTVRRNLLTPFGLRTLAPSDQRYSPVYEGPQDRRDEAYHNGPAWPYLMGAFIEAYLKINNFSPQSRTAAKGFLTPLLEHFTKSGCIGSISELFDAEPPYTPRGCFAQAWSVAEVLRAYMLTVGTEARS